MEEDKLFEERKEKLMRFFKSKYSWISYVLLAIIVYISVYIRTLPMKINSMTGKPGLWDITRDNWTLGPDLDPFLFLRYTKEIIANGMHLPMMDYLRYPPLYFNNRMEFVLEPYMMAYFHKIAALFGSTSVEHSVVIFPVIIFALGVIALFLYVRKSFLEDLGSKLATATALVAALFTSIIPALLPRTIAGIPDKQGSFVVFLFATLYFFVLAWNAKSLRNQIIFALIGGIISGLMGLYWGGAFIVLVAVVPAVFISFIINKIDRSKVLTYGVWLLSSLVIMNLFSPRFTLHDLISSFYTGSALALLFTLVAHLVLQKYVYPKYKLLNIPPQLNSIIISGVLVLILSLIFLGYNYTFDLIMRVIDLLIRPAPSDRFNVTVAQNRVPYLSEIASNFGPYLGRIPVFFTIFLAGSAYLLARLLHNFEKKDRRIIVGSYIFMLFAVLFSRYSPESSFNGANIESYILYALGLLGFAGSCLYFYWKYHKGSRMEVFNSLRFEGILLLVLFFFTLISVKGAVRLILLLVPTASIMGAYLVVALYKQAQHYASLKDDTKKIIYWIFFAIVLLGILFSAYEFYNGSKQVGASYIPSTYTMQWQLAMQWVRENTPINSVFAHWWDYGYWVQTMGERATVLDGGNYIVYWDYLMGRYVLTTESNQDALNFLYSHNSTHLLIDSTDIGKYSAFSSIGSESNYDRLSWIQGFVKDPQQTTEKKNSTSYVYVGGTPVDEDIIYETPNGTVFLPSSKAGLAQVVISRNSNGISQPHGFFVYQNQIYDIPLRYAYYSNQLIDFGSGIEAGVFIMSSVEPSSTGVSLDPSGALLYLSSRTVKTQFARLYLYNENNPNFKLVHTEDDILVNQIRGLTNQSVGNFVYYGGVRGPIKIWEINYPGGMKVDEAYLKTTYPNNEAKVK